jgi:hypothetical protein
MVEELLLAGILGSGEPWYTGTSRYQWGEALPLVSDLCLGYLTGTVPTGLFAVLSGLTVSCSAGLLICFWMGDYADMGLLLSPLSVTLTVLVPTPITVISGILVPLGGLIWADLANCSGFVSLDSVCLGDFRLSVALVELDVVYWAILVGAHILAVLIRCGLWNVAVGLWFSGTKLNIKKKKW